LWLGKVFGVFCTTVLLYLTHARTSQLIFILVIVTFVVIQIPSVSSFLEKNLVIIVMSVLAFSVLFSVVTVLLMQKDNPAPVVLKLNQVMTNRLELGAKYLNEYGVTFLGQHVQYYAASDGSSWWHNIPFSWLDNSYLKLIINYGIFWLVMYSVGMYFAAKKAQAVGDIKIIIPVLAVTILGISESTMLSTWFNFVLFSFAAAFKKSDSDITENS